MNKSEFNSYSFLEMENEMLRKKVKELEKKLKEAQQISISLTQAIELKNGNKSEDLQPKQVR